LSNVLPGTLIDRSFRERIILVGVIFPGLSPEAVDEALDELAQLVDSAGADVVGRVVQRRDSPEPATFIGRGKAEEIAALSRTLDADTVVFDEELSPAQQRNLEKVFGRTAIDRTAVILDIFAQNARTGEGRAQVELAQLRYRLPRLRGRGLGLSQQAGGIGTRGPGETQLEVDRRRLVRRMTKLEGELRRLTDTRRLQRKSRRRGRLATVSLVGYTNAGKSTLLNQLTDAGVLVEDRLFATLDPRTRRLALPGGESVLLSDTVGFVRKLPHQLVEAFRSTLEVVKESDLLVHVVDSAGPDPEVQMEAVRVVLEEIGAAAVPELVVFNKADATDEAKRLAGRYPGSVVISALSGEGIEELLAAIGDRLRATLRIIDLVVPYDRGDVLAAVHREGEVLVETHGETAARLRVRVDQAGAARFRELECDEHGRLLDDGAWGREGDDE
jgi:GTP-binding protein HflX